ncbi:MAG: hypothetical protein WAX44_02130 [Minisyncoccia bacterium]
MKKTVINLVAFLLVFAATQVSAQTGVTPTNNLGPRSAPRPAQVIKERLEERRENSSTTNAMQEMKELRERMSSSTKERMGNSVEVLRRVLANQVRRMFDRIQATIDRQKTISGKISTRIEKIKSAGGNTSESERYMSDANTHIGNAQSMLNSMKEASTTIASLIDMGRKSSTTARELSRARGVVSEIEKELRLSHGLMVKAVVNLKGMSSSRNKATTTSSN